MAQTVTNGANSLALVYDSEHNRVQQCAPDCTSPTTTTNYLNDPVTGKFGDRSNIPFLQILSGRMIQFLF